MAFISTFRPFPICFQETTPDMVGKKTNYPIGVDKDTIFKWWYRARKWKSEMDFDLESMASVTGESASASASLSGISPITQSINSILASESNLVCSSPFYYFSMGPFENSQTDSQPEAVATAQVYTSSIQFTLEFAATRTIGDVYYPRIEIYTYLYANGQAGSNEGVVDCVSALSSNPFLGTPDEFNYPVDVNFSIDGQPFVLEFSYNSLRFTDGTGSYSDTVQINRIAFTIDEYWAYNPGSGGDVYNTSTGSTLRDPFSIQSW